MPGPTRKRHARQQRTGDTAMPRARRRFHVLLLFVTSVLVANALIGERGLFASLAARREHRQLADHIRALERENDRLRAEAHRLRVDPHAVEEVARQELGLIKPGELVFLLHDGPGVRARTESRRRGPSASQPGRATSPAIR